MDAKWGAVLTVFGGVALAAVVACSRVGVHPDDGNGGLGTSSSSSSGGGFGGSTSGAGGTCAMAPSVTTGDLDADFGAWKPPPPVADACTPAELATMATTFDALTDAQTLLDVVGDVSAGCKQCVLSSETDDAWATLVLFDPAGGDGFLNLGACYARFDNFYCGKAENYAVLCTESVCEGCSGDAGACEAAALAAGGACAELAGDVGSACSKPNADATCGSFAAAVAFMCGNQAPGDM